MAETQHVLATRMGSLRLGHIEEFDTSLEWNSYASRLMFYLEANKVSSDADKRAVLLSSCGSALFKLVESLLSPAKPVERSFDEIISVLNDHFAPQPSEIVNRHIFYQRKQQPGETVAEFIADLRRLAQGCNFVDLETMLRDRLVCGLRDEAVQLRLFAKKVLTFQMAQEEALSAEAACEPVSLDLDPSVLPVRMKARKVPLALKEKIDMELDKLVKQKVLEPVSHPVWATPIVTPMKADGSLRICDHKPLLGIFAPNKETPYILSPRMLRWTVMLGAYVYDICYRLGKLIANADILSRLPTKIPDFEIPPPLEVLMLESDDTVIMKANDIARMSLKDPLISRVLNWAWKGWPAKLSDKKFKPFFIRQLEISVHKGCLLWGNRVVIPSQARSRLLTVLHDGHPGIVRMKALARRYFWWPKMDEDIEKTVNTRDVCQSSRAAMPKAPVHSWETPNNPWSRSHIDFAGPFQGKTFLIVVDTFSKWLEVIPISEMSTRTVIEELHQLFATHGLPNTIVSDNAAQFLSVEFQQFLKRGAIRHARIAPFHPASNGQAERMVRTTKEALRKMVHGSWKQRLANFLFLQRVSPCATTGKSPAELLMKRRLRTVLDRIHPDIEVEAIEGNSDVTKPDKQKIRKFAPDDLVFARNYAHGPKWCPATIVAPTGPVFYKVRTTDGQLWKRHLDQLRKRHPSIEVTEDTETDVNKTQQSNIADNSSQTEQEDCQQLMEKSPSAVVEPIAERIPEPITETIAEQPTRPPRTRRKPNGIWRETHERAADGAHLLGLKVWGEQGKLMLKRDNDVGVAADELTRRSVFSYCGKLVAHFPVCGWLRIAATYIKRKANDATTSWDEVIEAVEAKVWVDASSQAVGVALEIGGSVVEDVAWLSLDDAQHINMAELDAVIKSFNMAFSWQITKIRLMTDSVTVHQWVTDGLSRKTRLRTKATGEMLIRRKVGIVLLLVEEFVLELYVELVRSANNKADELTRVPRQ
ncbi:Uncharacterized protein T03_10050 [Trichinella britovi]|uniref:RNA-directed DNA polymerase n=2 Tax=Trichinella TaxID=6333 RepID=A0A0V1D4I1_TRIBR|nr:Uncharacterized protein T03_10050 [Trichinella britovi]